MPGNPLNKGKSKNANNSEGNNGPEEDVLADSLHEYARLGHSLDVRLQKLFDDHGLRIGKTLLKNLNSHFNVPSVRKPIPREVADQQILNEMADDIHGYRGPGTVKRNLALSGYQIPRRIIRETMLLNHPEGVDARYPGKKKIKRAQLKAHGTWQEIHCDGHEKLGALALQMGGVGLPIYGMKDKWGDGILYLVVVPDDRNSDAIGHVVLDFIELYGAIPQQMTTDKGSETGHLYAFMTGLKTAYAPDIDLTRYPSMVALKSTNNTPIEALWRWFQEQSGKNLYVQITRGRDEGIFNPGIYSIGSGHPSFKASWITSLSDGTRMSSVGNETKSCHPGVSPNELYAHPEYFGGRCFAIPVPKDATNALRNTIKTPRKTALSWVPDEFDLIAWQVYEMIGSPLCTPETAWDVFSKMASVMR
ncbi:hypothetical protein MSAN_00866500 [Mycena sanguinolenta]|uniref:Uncharacterized protein n=1 Tax=Mycena sanguinolenta TaxID=230812 RepID=A0A8H7DCN3_9AGAR|nr:hypothetical protein MSAN_00866500 [Mycena sanguinolenta]